MGVLEGLGDEVWPDDFQPRRVPQNIRAAVGDGFVYDVPGLDLALVAANDGVNVIAHSLEQLLAGRAWPGKATATEAAAAGRIRIRRGGGRRRWSVRHPGRHIGALKNPSGRLAVPDECVPYDIHAVAQAEVNVGVRRGEIVAVGAFPRMDECPFQVVLRGDLVELFLHESNVLIDRFQGPVDVVGPDRGASRDSAVDGRAYAEVVFEGVLEGRRVGRPGRCPHGKQHRKGKADA